MGQLENPVIARGLGSFISTKEKIKHLLGMIQKGWGVVGQKLNPLPLASLASIFHLPVSVSQRRSSRSSSASQSPRGAFFILQLHDELIYEVHEGDIEPVASIVRQEMENAMKLSSIMPVKIKVGPSWGSLKDMEDAGK